MVPERSSGSADDRPTKKLAHASACAMTAACTQRAAMLTRQPSASGSDTAIANQLTITTTTSV